MNNKTSLWNTRTRVLIYITVAAFYLIGVLIFGIFMPEDMYAVDYSAKFTAPCMQHIFGTDFMGRDMFFRCVKGLSTSLVIAVIAAAISSVIALVIGVAAAVLGGKADS